MIQAVSVILVYLLHFFNIPLVSSLWLTCKTSSLFCLSGCTVLTPFMELVFLMIWTSVHAETVAFLIDFTPLCMLRSILLIVVFCAIRMDKNERDPLESIIPIMYLGELKPRQTVTSWSNPELNVLGLHLYIKKTQKSFQWLKNQP